MSIIIRLLSLLLCCCVLLMGCSRTTTVILPPETTSHGTGTTAAPTKSAGTEATEPPITEPSAPTQPPATNPPTEAPTTPSTEAPTTPSTEAPAATPPTEVPPETIPTPSEEPTDEPTSEPDRHPVYDITGHSIGSLEYMLLDAINSNRADASLDALALDSKLCALAAIRAYECAESFSQIRPDGRSAYSVLTDYGYGVWSNFGQRIHYGSASLSASSIVKGWMHNGDFSANILSGDFTHLGIGVYTAGGTTYIVCFFTG